MSTTMNTSFCNFCYYMFFMAVAIRTAVGQAPAAAPTAAPTTPAAAPATPAPLVLPPAAGPTNITKILEKGGPFSTLIKLMTSTQVADRINIELNNTNNAMTILAPTDAAFAALKPGTLNSLTDQDKADLVQFHIIPSFIALSQFQTLTNPVRTQAGDVGKYAFPLNVTTSSNTVKISTGIVNTTISNFVYSDNQLAVYQVDKVLLPQGIFGPKPPPPPPSPVIPKKEKSSPPVVQAAPVVTSGDMGLRQNALVALASAAVAVLWL